MPDFLSTHRNKKVFYGDHHGCPEFERVRRVLGSVPSVHGGESRATRSFSILGKLGKRLCQFSSRKTFGNEIQRGYSCLLILSGIVLKGMKVVKGFLDLHNEESGSGLINIRREPK
jgi:hypothetical protein